MTQAEFDNNAVRYEREIDERGEDSLSILVRWLKPGMTVLDVGTGTGALGRYCKARGIVIDGLEYDRGAIETAAPHYRDLLCIDLMRDDIAAALGDRLYDTIVVADVLEHVIDPVSALNALMTSLKPDGQVLVSIPNIGHMNVIAGLMNEQFEYRDIGLLDHTHLRFFTADGVRGLLQRTGLAAVEVCRTILPPESTEFGLADLAALPHWLTAHLAAAPEALTYQYVLKATRRSDATPVGASDAFDDPGPPDMVVRLVAQLAEDKTTTVSSGCRLARSPGPLELALGATADLKGLTILLGDRPGAAGLKSIELRNTAGTVVATYAGNFADLRGHTRDLAFMESRDGETVAWRLGWHPAIRLPLDAGQLKALASGCVCSLDLGPGPMQGRLRRMLQQPGGSAEPAEIRQQVETLIDLIAFHHSKQGHLTNDLQLMTASRDRIQSDLALMTDSRNQAASNLKLMTQSRDQAMRDLALMTESRDQAVRELALMAQSRDQAVRDLTLMTESRDQAVRDLALMTESRDQAVRDLALMTESRDRAEALVQALNADLSHQISELAAMTADRDRLARDLGEILADRARVIGEFTALTAVRADLEAQVAALQSANADLTETLKTTVDTLAVAESGLTVAHARLAELDSLKGLARDFGKRVWAKIVRKD